MQRIPFDLRSVRLARQLRSTAAASLDQLDDVQPRQRAKIAATYATVPDAVLARMERLLLEREQLKQMISTLLQRVA